jgi:hypothetical protein
MQIVCRLLFITKEFLLNNKDWKIEAEKLRFEEKYSWSQLASYIKKKYFFDLDTQQVQEKVRAYIRNTPQYKKGKITYEDKRDVKAGSVKDYFQALKNINNAVDELDTKQTNATLQIDDDKPIAVAFWGDWHIGAKGVDYNRLDYDSFLINQTDGLYLIGMGDYKDNANALIHANAVQEGIAQSDMQDLLVKDILCRHDEQLIALIRGCHDDWDKRLSNKDFIQMLCDETDSINLWHGGMVNIKIGNQNYKIGARHKYKWESGLNTTNSQRNFINDWGICDVVCFAHKHFPDLQHTKRMGRDTVYMRSGSYKVYDEFGQKLAGYEGQHGVPCIILYPNKHEIVPFKSLERGIEYLNVLRKE